MEQREAERHLIMQQYPGFYRITTVVILIGIGILIGWILFADKDGYGMNLWTEFVGVGFTFLVLDWWTRQQDDRQSKRQHKERLTREMANPDDNVTALNAVREAKSLGWLTDGTLRNTHLEAADLSRADLENSDLQNSNLNGAVLKHANLSQANLQGALLIGANLTHAQLHKANFKQALLSGSNFQGAMLRFADLENAHLDVIKAHGTLFENSNMRSAILRFSEFKDTLMSDVDLQFANFQFTQLNSVMLYNANLKNAKFIQATLSGVRFDGADLMNADFSHVVLIDNNYLPDGAKWAHLSEIERFTNPEHPDFWRSNDPKSPAYQGKQDDEL